MKRISPLFKSIATPAAVFGSLLAIVFATEMAVMLLLPYLFPTCTQFVGVLADAFLLTLLIAPAAWWLIARPLKQAAAEEAAKADVLLQSLNDAVVGFDDRGNVWHLNPAAERIFGYRHPQDEGLDIGLLLPEHHPSLYAGPGAPCPEKAAPAGGETTARRKDGTTFPAEFSLGSVEMRGSRRFIAIVQDITQRKRYEAQLEYHANYDPLTGLVNRNLLADRLRQALLMARRSGHAVGVFLLDLDNFKLVNETLGQDGGDLLLKAVAERLPRCLRACETVSRRGGDEFVIVVSDHALPDTAPVIAEKLREAMAPPFSVKGQEVVVTTSIGISISPKDGEDVPTLLSRAEAALYRTKEAGRDSFRFYTDEMNAKTVARMNLEKHLRRALERGEFSLYYQPKVSLTSGLLTGMEALIRWKNPELGNVPPAAFIPLAEETGLILPIGAWVLKTACAQTRAWHEAGYAPVCVAVNLSPRQLREPEVATTIAACLSETGLEARFLELEVTESMVMHDVAGVALILDELKGMGVSLAMDDFGTGYSSLGYLRRFPFDKLKIDHSFVRDITSEPDNAAIANAVIAMAHSLHMKVIAEGVETKAQLNYLRGQGCDEIQGYYFSRPVPAADFERLLAEQGETPLPLPAAGTPEQTVLVVDDDEGVLNSLQRLLALEGYTVLLARGAAEGFERLALQKAAVVISDFRMPGMSGTEFLARVKELHPDTVRIMLSGHADLEAVTTAVNLGAVYKVLHKPWDDDDVLAKVAEASRRYQSLRFRSSASS